MNRAPDSGLIEALCRIADEAGAVIMKFYEDGAAVRTKAGSSPVTEADEAAERHIKTALRALTPEVPIVAEESFAAGDIPEVGEDPFWLVDPLDGTKEFINRNGEFTVNIGLIEAGKPVMGVVTVPAIVVTFFATGPGAAYVRRGGAASEPISARPAPPDGLVAAVSRSHRNAETDTYLAAHTIKHERSAGSSMKFGLIAAGEADLYPRLGRTMEWDTAAGDAVLRAAGGSVRSLDGKELVYGKDGFANPPFVARGRDA